ncbi:class I SAM-dependent methyltransferase [Idiomarina xiamenensis]|uniref:Type 11 methyltransferase n=1 Tax=Idiomarina xiamenensis 10-D-4 TaxID=740709 RepID=K2KPD0_9GAMM|nr:methyltransferase domain-containing protein [Idiomarina xiamenensis]EKE84244.1 type 11 methyltransferase [Idiomarina xiamenensis 10-D-4]
MRLKPALLEHCLTSPNNWQQLAHGEWLLQQANEVIAEPLSQAFGYHLIKCGNLAAQLDTQCSPVKHQLTMLSELSDLNADAQLQASYCHWPFAEASIDAVLMAGVLEFERDPHQVLREATHSLIADGHLLLIGFNPLSPAVLPGLIQFEQRQYPWRGRYFTRARVLDWLALLHYEVIDSQYFAASLLWPKLTPKSNPSPAWLQALAKRLPLLGSCYLIVARKREYPLTLVGKKKRQAKPVNGLRLAGMSQRR